MSDSWCTNFLLETMQAGGVGLCLIVRYADGPSIALAAKACGFDGLVVDMEHGTITAREAGDIALVGLLAGITVLVRVSGPDSPDVARLVDAGALGIVFPHIDSAERAVMAVDSCKFAPLGSRSVSQSYPQSGFRGILSGDVRAALNSATIAVAMIESQEAIDNLETIASVPGLDVLHLGLGDYCAAKGISAMDDPRAFDAFNRVVASCRENGLFPGIGGLSAHSSLLKRYIDAGARYVTAANDLSLLLEAGTSRVKSVRDLCE